VAQNKLSANNTDVFTIRTGFTTNLLDFNKEECNNSSNKILHSLLSCMHYRPPRTLYLSRVISHHYRSSLCVAWCGVMVWR